MKWVLTIIVATLAGVCGAWSLYTFAPQSIFTLIGNTQPRFGSTITNIAGSDTLSASRSVINTNFTNLNSTKIENSTTSVEAITTLANLATIGTITSGTWHGTIIVPTYGGTGSSTLSANELFVGNGTGNVLSLGWGTSGQFLSSNGVGSLPTWVTNSIDTTANYNFTGTIRIKNLNASSTVANPFILNGVSFNTPSTQGSASTVLTNDGSGSLTWSNPYFKTLYNTSGTTISTATNASTSLLTVAIPGNTFSTTASFEGKILFSTIGGASPACSFDINFGTGSATTTVFSVTLTSNSRMAFYDLEGYATSTSAMTFYTHGADVSSGGANYPGATTGFNAWIKTTPHSLTATTYISIIGNSFGGNSCLVSGLTLKAVTQ